MAEKLFTTKLIKAIRNAVCNAWNEIALELEFIENGKVALFITCFII